MNTVNQPVRKRDLKLKDHNVSRAKYNELKHFCLQYIEKKKTLTESYSFQHLSGTARGRSNGTNQSNESRAVRNAGLYRDIKLIEDTAKEADERIYQYIIKNVTEGIPYEYMDVPMGRKQFYESRRYFFLLLARKK